jgi:hypothetical protein
MSELLHGKIPSTFWLVLSKIFKANLGRYFGYIGVFTMDIPRINLEKIPLKFSDIFLKKFLELKKTERFMIYFVLNHLLKNKQFTLRHVRSLVLLF